MKYFAHLFNPTSDEELHLEISCETISEVVRLIAALNFSHNKGNQWLTHSITSKPSRRTTYTPFP